MLAFPLRSLATINRLARGVSSIRCVARGTLISKIICASVAGSGGGRSGIGCLRARNSTRNRSQTILSPVNRMAACCTTCTSGDRITTSQRIHNVVHSSRFRLTPFITCEDISLCRAAVSSTIASHACAELFASSSVAQGRLLLGLLLSPCRMQPGARHNWSEQWFPA